MRCKENLQKEGLLKKKINGKKITYVLLKKMNKKLEKIKTIMKKKLKI